MVKSPARTEATNANNPLVGNLGVLKKLDQIALMWGFPQMSTVTADDRKRVRIPDAKPGQVFAYENNADGSVTLTPIKLGAKLRFPRGSLKKYVTPENNREMLRILKGCVQRSY